MSSTVALPTIGHNSITVWLTYLPGRGGVAVASILTTAATIIITPFVSDVRRRRCGRHRPRGEVGGDLVGGGGDDDGGGTAAALGRAGGGVVVNASTVLVATATSVPLFPTRPFLNPDPASPTAPPLRRLLPVAVPTGDFPPVSPVQSDVIRRFGIGSMSATLHVNVGTETSLAWGTQFMFAPLTARITKSSEVRYRLPIQHRALPMPFPHIPLPAPFSPTAHPSSPQPVPIISIVTGGSTAGHARVLGGDWCIQAAAASDRARAWSQRHSGRIPRAHPKGNWAVAGGASLVGGSSTSCTSLHIQRVATPPRMDVVVGIPLALPVVSAVPMA